MNTAARLACIAALATLGACAGTPPARLFTLDDGQPSTARSLNAPSVAVVRVSVPELIDRPQLVFRTDGNQVAFSEQYRWATPIRREIPRLIANDLGEALDSNRVVSQPADTADSGVDFRLTLDVQQLDAVAGQGVVVDVLWRIEPRSGKAVVGRSRFRQPSAAAVGEANVATALVAANRQALRHVATEIAKQINSLPKP